MAKYVSFKKRLFIIGFGVIAAGTVPLIMKHIDISPEQFIVLAKDPDMSGCAAKYGIEFRLCELLPENYKDLLSDLQEGDLLLNLSINVSCFDLMKLCIDKKAYYLDTCHEPWDGFYYNTELSASTRSVYGLREEFIKIRDYEKEKRSNVTLVSCNGANPGLVSHLVKQGLVNLAKDFGLDTKPQTPSEWAHLAKELGITTIQVAERDTQLHHNPKRRGEFVGTWSVDGLISEGVQPAELGWGTNEKTFPIDGVRHDYGCQSAIYLNCPGLTVKVRSWTPKEGPYQGFLVCHTESVTLSNYLTVKNSSGDVIYRPTVHYAYHPCDSTILSVQELGGKNWQHEGLKQRIVRDDIYEGMDELGVFLCGHKKNAYWYGSQLSIERVRETVEYNNATTLQVTCAVLGGLVWLLENPNRGFVEPEDMDYERVLEICNPYLGNVGGFYSDWNPLVDRELYFPESLDKTDPWQFKNIRV